jgi:hypothetical protein
MNNELTRAVFGDNLDKTFTLSDVLSGLNNMDLLNIGELAELAISMRSGIEKCDKLTENIDLKSGYQIKHARTHLRPNGYWIATVSRNTTAPILLVISETKTKKQYFFHIPYKAHRHLSGNTIGISFGAHGWPSSSQWWAYEVKSFDELCKIAKNA